MKNRVLRSFLSVCLGCVVPAVFFIHGALADAGYRIVPPREQVAGQSQVYWAQKWWNWVLNIRGDINPNYKIPNYVDPTGGKYASINNDGPIVFLPGILTLKNYSSINFARTLTIPPDRPVLVVIRNTFFIAFPDAAPCPNPLTLACALTQVSPPLDSASGLSIEVDGHRLGNTAVKAFRQTDRELSDVWVNPYPENLYATLGLNDPKLYGYFPKVAVQDGYYVFIDHLSKGKHVIKTTGSVGAPYNNFVAVTSTVCVGVRTTVEGTCHE